MFGGKVFRIVVALFELLPYVYLTSLTDTRIQMMLLVLQQAEAFLTELYHGKPKACDLARFVEKVKAGEDSCVSFEALRSTMIQLKNEVR